MDDGADLFNRYYQLSKKLIKCLEYDDEDKTFKIMQETFDLLENGNKEDKDEMDSRGGG